ncbi:MAG TPA: hypothetical protein DEA08_36940 [Planctomycetes bacterium]|nr:hypothetical protein [Planctomycetota bacterium]
MQRSPEVQEALLGLVDEAFLCWVVSDAEGRLLGGAGRLAGRLVSDLLGSTWSEVIGHPLAPTASSERVRAPGPLGEVPLRLHHRQLRDGSRLTLVVDQSELQAAEEYAREATRRLGIQKDALDEHAIVAITDRRGRITYANDKFCEISGYSRAELLGQDHRLLNSGHHPREFFKRLWATIGKGHTWRGEICNRAKDGSLYWVDTTIVPIKDAEGQVEEYVAIRADITDRKDFEASLALLASLVEASEDAIVRESADGLITSWNPAAERIYGYKVGQVLGRPIEELFPDAAGKTEDRQGALEIARSNSAGQQLVVAETIAPVLNDGEVVAWVRISRDVTQRKQLEERLSQAAKLAALGELAGNVAHEINNPIGIVSGKARLLLSGRHELSEKVRGELEKVVAQCDRVGRLTHGLLDYCRPSINPREPLDPQVPLGKALSLVRSKAERRGVKVCEQLLEERVLVEANGNELEQVFLNLFLNAIDAMPQGGALAVESIRTAREGRPGIELQVRDTGDGIPRELLKRVFEPFFTTKGVKGTGLGLAICYGLITNHGGAIEVESEPEQGTAFRIWLPEVER